ncbi:hypothetical protein ACJZ2D_008620 [Fusarium nematophilum]
MTTASKPLRVGVLGPAGFGGSYLCVELVSRGHSVIGMSRFPEKLGKHELYEPRVLDVEQASISDLARAFSDVDAVVSEYGPHTAGHDALQYSQSPGFLKYRIHKAKSEPLRAFADSDSFWILVPFMEVIRKIVLAVKRSKVGYFVMVAGAGSLHLPHEDDECAADSKDFFLAYRRALAESHAHVTYMEERLGPLGSNLRAYRNARLALRRDDCGQEDKAAAQAVIDEYEAKIKQKDPAADFIKGARTTNLFFDGNTSFPWTYVSPSPMYRPGKRTGSYEVHFRDMPLKGEPSASGNVLDGRLLGISAADLAIAIADDVETKRYIHQHWTATADLSDDTPAPSYVRF